MITDIPTCPPHHVDYSFFSFLASHALPRTQRRNRRRLNTDTLAS